MAETLTRDLKDNYYAFLIAITYEYEITPEEAFNLFDYGFVESTNAKRIPDSTIEEIYQQKVEGKTYKEIARKYKKSAAWVSRLLWKYINEHDIKEEDYRPKRRKIVPNAITTTIITMRDEGATFKEIAAVVGKTSNAVSSFYYDYLSREGIKGNVKPRYSPEFRAKIIELKYRGNTTKEIAEILGKSQNCIRAIIYRESKKNKK